MIETQIIVKRMGELWFKGQYRKVYFLFRGRWIDIKPIWHLNIEAVEEQIKNLNNYV